jgi:hypothetical protein
MHEPYRSIYKIPLERRELHRATLREASHGFAQPSNLELSRVERSRNPYPARNLDCTHRPSTSKPNTEAIWQQSLGNHTNNEIAPVFLSPKVEGNAERFHR